MSAADAILLSLPYIFSTSLNEAETVRRVQTEIASRCTEEDAIDVIADLVVRLVRTGVSDRYASVIDQALAGLGHHGFEAMVRGVEYDSCVDLFFFTARCNEDPII